MELASPRFWRLVTLAFLAISGPVLWSYQKVSSPTPLVLAGVALGWLAMFTLAAWGAGGWLRPCLVGEAFLTGAVLRLAAGSGVLALLATLLGLASLLYSWLVALIALGLAALGAFQLWRASAQFPSPRLWWSLPWVLLLPGALLAFLAALVDSAFYDQLNYHLALPFHWLRGHRLVVFPRHDYSLLPATMSSLFTYGLAILPPWSAQLLHWWMGALATAGVAALAQQLGAPSGWAAAVFATTPAVVLSATWAASDLGGAAFAAATWLSVLVAVHRQQDPRFWVLAGGLAGLAMGCKLLVVATLVAPAALVVVGSAVVVYPRRLWWRRGAVGLALFLTGLLASFAPWLVRAWVLTGNPLYPAFSSSPVGAGASSALLGGELTVDALLTTAKRTLAGLLLGTFNPQGAAGLVGPAYLMLLPVALLWLWQRRPRDGLLLMAGFAAGVVGWSLLPQLPRYLLAALVPGAAVMGVAWAQLMQAWRPAAARWLSGFLAAAVLWGALGGLSPEVMMRVGVALGQMDRAQWLRTAVDYWPAAQFVNQSLPLKARLLLVAEARSLYIEREVMVEDPFKPPLLTELAEASPTPQAMAQQLRAMGVTHLLVNWREAERIAALNRRSQYFAPQSQQAETNLREFFRGFLELLLREGNVELYRLRTPQERGGGSW